MKREKYYCLYPKSLNLEKRIKEYKPDFDYNLDYFYFLLNRISKQSTFKIQKDEDDVWIPLCSNVLINHPYNYKKHLRYLLDELDSDKILWGNRYEVGKCYSYRLAPKYFNDNLKIYKITDKKLLKYLNKYYPKKVKTNNPFDKKYKFLSKYFKSGLLKINIDRAMQENERLYKCNWKDPVKASLKQRLNAIQIIDIANEDYKITHSHKTDGRIHTQLTYLNKNLRKYITYNGKRLAEVDIKSSVPTMLYYILKEFNKSRQKQDLLDIINSISNYHYMSIKGLQVNNYEEVISFGKEILNKGLYKLFYKDFEYLVNEESTLRDVVKEGILGMMNARSTKFKKIQKIFKRYFPSILVWINKFKKDKHELFSYLTMQTEAHFMLNVVAREINKRYRGKIVLFTLHDSLITTEDDLDILYGIMADILDREMGFTPILTKKVWK